MPKPEILVFEQENTQIYFHKHYKVLHLKWRGPDCRSIYLEVIEALKRLTIELKAESWLFDLSKCETIQTSIEPKDLDQLALALKESKLKKYARVVSSDVDYETAIRQKIPLLNKHYDLGIEVANFGSETDALAWLFNASPGTLMEE